MPDDRQDVQERVTARINVRTPHGEVVPRGMAGERVLRSASADPGMFGRMFPNLPAHDFTDEQLNKLNQEIQKNSDPPGGPAGGANNPRIRAGFTFFGQFTDHDMTFDPNSSLEKQNDPDAITNFRTPALELDTVYGSGPAVSPHLYDQAQPGKLLIGVDANGEANDLPRNRQGVALIGDPRNDENLIISQMHLAFLKFHNAVVDHIRADGVEEGLDLPDDPEVVFREAQRVVRWHYQWIISHEFLNLIAGDDIIEEILDDDRGGRRDEDPVSKVRKRHLEHFKFKDEPFIPVEFAVAAYRFGHSQVRAAYSINQDFAAQVFPEGVEDPNFAGTSLFIPANLTTDTRVLRTDPPRVVDWTRFNDIPGIAPPPPPPVLPQQGLTIDGKISPSLFRLPAGLPALGEPTVRSLPLRNLLRGRAFKLPWGQRVADAIGTRRISDDDLGLVALGFPRGRAPLWFYILKEAEVQNQGTHLGKVGRRIVAEVLLGLLIGDPKSYLSQNRRWRPFLPSGKKGDFTLGALFKFAGVGAFPPRDR